MAIGNENVSVGMIQCLTDNKQVTNNYIQHPVINDKR